MTTTDTQSKAILAWLKQGRTITPLEALRRFHSLRLGARIYDLRQAGHDIKSRMIEVGDGKRVAQYRLERKAVA